MVLEELMVLPSKPCADQHRRDINERARLSAVGKERCITESTPSRINFKHHGIRESQFKAP